MSGLPENPLKDSKNNFGEFFLFKIAKKNYDSGWNDKGRSARVWMGKAFGDVPPVPVRLTLDTPLGALIAHLSAAEYASGGQKVKLGR